VNTLRIGDCELRGDLDDGRRSQTEKIHMRRPSRWSRKVAKSAIRALVNPVLGKPCPACGRRAILTGHKVISPQLAAAWDQPSAWVRRFDQREGRCCTACGNSIRSRELARTIVDQYNHILALESRSLAELVDQESFRQLAIAEINSCGGLHDQLRRLPRLSFSEYGSTVPEIPNQSLMGLTYPDNSFDLVLTSETLEHVPDVATALCEIFRVLKPAGLHIFTVPIVYDRLETRRRAMLDVDGKIEHLLSPSYHASSTHNADDYLVFWEFGADFENTVRAVGFDLTVIKCTSNPAVVTFIAEK
jgi:SAM-dependent methyltransferase